REERELKAAFKKSELLQYKTSVVLVDGALTFSHLDSKTKNLREKFLGLYWEKLKLFYEKKQLVAAYTSLPRTRDLIKKFGSSKKLKLTDADVLKNILKSPSQNAFYRTETFSVNNHIYFCYINVGTEIARIEFPEWIAQNNDYVGLVCKVCCNQVQKGRGYPICLAEAHVQAVVTAAEQNFFYGYLQKMRGAKNSTHGSQKMARKRSLFS
ncbi:DNA double-strand break repair nuclease NurA, partial [Candidatus Babeliales bacterium]|nr:DNA double-strand break repair nuclease NurA [Candidatus Babeliales bacterium]